MDSAANADDGAAGDDSQSAADEEAAAGGEATAVDEGQRTADDETTAVDDELAELRAAVDEKYDFENFGPADMAKMTPAEWEAAFDADTWITGPRLLDRVERDLQGRIAARDVFAVLERQPDGETDRLLAYSDEGYAVVSADGTVEGRGGVLRDVEPVVAMCSIAAYEVPDPPADYELPAPDTVPEQTGEFGNLMLQLVAGMQFLGGLALIVAWLLTDLDSLVAPVVGGLFAVVGFALFLLVANARLSDRFRAEQYRNRLRAVEVEGIDRPTLPSEPDGQRGGNADRERGANADRARPGQADREREREDA